MMSIPQLFFGVAALLVVGASAAHNEGNPIQRVVNMIQALQLKVEQTGKEEERLFDEYMCYCKESSNNLQKSIGDAETKIPQVEGSLKELRSEKDQLTSDLAQHQQDLSDAQQSLDEATATRNKEADTYSKTSADMSANIAAMGKAIAALEKGAAGAFLQTASAATLRHLSTDASLTDSDQEMLSSFLQGGNDMEDSDGFASRGGEITGILKQLKETTESDLKQATEDEDKAKKEYDSLSAAKNAEIDALKQVIQQKTQRLGEVSSEIAQSEEDLDDTKTSLAEDKKFFAELEVNCEAKKSEWEVRSKTRSEELLAIGDTLKILNDGSALDLFKSSLPLPSFLQERADKNDRRERAFAFLQQGARRGIHGMGDRRMGLLAMTLHGKHAQFDKVIAMVDEMVTLLGKEQVEDDSKFAYCTKELDTAEAKKAAFESAISDLGKLIDSGKQSIVTLVEEISTLAKGVKELDAEVAEATKMRQEENNAFIEEMSSNSAAKDLLFIAKNRLSQFYKKAALLQIQAHKNRVAPPPPPAGFGGGSGSNKKESGGVLVMIDELSADLGKEMEEAKAAESKSQTLYEEFIGESKKKRATDSKLIAEKEGHKAGAEESLNKNLKDKKSKGAENFANNQYITSLHKECDFILENYKLRQRARVGEIASLKNAKAVLTSAGGASFLQLDSVHAHLRGSN